MITYDSRTRLTSEVWYTTPALTGNVFTYTYDGIGTLVSRTDSSGTVTYFAHLPPNSKWEEKSRRNGLR